MIELLIYFWKPSWLPNVSVITLPNHMMISNSTLIDLFVHTDNNDIAFLIIIAVVGVLATISAALLVHLCFFHFYITCRGLTTYEYIRAQRRQSLAQSQPKCATISGI